MLEITRLRLNVPARIASVAEGQAGYFTRAQAAQAGVGDYELDRAVTYEQIVRLDTGIYRVVGAAHDPRERLRVAYLRLSPEMTPAERRRGPVVWVSHQSAADLHGFGVFLADTPEFIVDRRRWVNGDMKLYVRSGGVPHRDWVVKDGFAVTSVIRTAVDLYATHTDQGHIGRFLGDALQAGAATRGELDAQFGTSQVEATLAMA
ncbi:MAG: hypothetical protein GEU79_18875 [Acidimicrobiia bacterium]|nr:hypothetical protein [Acidimicrobiia bacterium]